MPLELKLRRTETTPLSASAKKDVLRNIIGLEEITPNPPWSSELPLSHIGAEHNFGTSQTSKNLYRIFEDLALSL
jgi:hypothetical protein